jgi:hypothetical protein
MTYIFSITIIVTLPSLSAQQFRHSKELSYNAKCPFYLYLNGSSSTAALILVRTGPITISSLMWSSHIEKHDLTACLTIQSIISTAIGKNEYAILTKLLPLMLSALNY